jgi:hypothetical protein
VTAVSLTEYSFLTKNSKMSEIVWGLLFISRVSAHKFTKRVFSNPVSVSGVFYNADFDYLMLLDVDVILLCRSRTRVDLRRKQKRCETN